MRFSNESLACFKLSSLTYLTHVYMLESCLDIQFFFNYLFILNPNEQLIGVRLNIKTILSQWSSSKFYSEVGVVPPISLSSCPGISASGSTGTSPSGVNPVTVG